MMPSRTRRRSARLGLTALLGTMFTLAFAATLHAQAVIDPRVAEFDPSPDHSVVSRYDLEVYLVGASAPFETVDMGKPSPDPDGKIRYDFSSQVAAWLLTGSNLYEARVSAVGAEGSARSTPSNQFTFTTPSTCTISVDATTVSASATGGSYAVNVTAGTGCEWTAVSDQGWLVPAVVSGTGNATVAFTASANNGTTSRTATLTIDSWVVIVTQLSEWPDLVMMAVSAPPAAAAPGTSFTVADSVQNLSAAGAKASTTRYYLSLDAVRDGGDVLLSGHRNLSPLAADGTSGGSTTVAVPATTVPGVYRVFACADARLTVREADEANNCLAAATTVRIGWPGLVTTTGGNQPKAEAPETTVTMTGTVPDPNPVVAAPPATRYEVSRDALKDGSDVLPAAGATPVLGATSGGSATSVLAATSGGSATVVVPATTVPGTDGVLAAADGALSVKSPAEATNYVASASAVPVGGPADPVATTATNPPAAAAPATSNTVTDTVPNPSAVVAAAPTKRYAASGDALTDGSDVLPAAGATSSGPGPVTIPATFVPGAYGVLAPADGAPIVEQPNEASDDVASASTELVGEPDLVATAVGNLPADAAPGTSFSVTDTVQNLSAMIAGASRTRYYLSLDAVKDGSDVLLFGYRSFSLLAAGGTSSGSATVAVPTATAPGIYRVIACAEGRLTVDEAGEANNCAVSEAAVVIR